VRIDGREIGPGCEPYVIAEMSNNHLRDFERALAIMEAAKAAGADAVKLQTYSASRITIDCERPEFQITDGLWKGQTLYRLYDGISMPWDWHERLFEKGRELGITVFSSPFDDAAIDLLESLDAPAYKIASFELVDLALVKQVAAIGKPVVMSTGMASQEEIAEALAAAREAGARDVALLHCVSGYPTPVEESNLRTIPHLAERFDCTVGLSDHTLGIVTAIAAVALGASIIEKHVTLRRADGGPDAAFSLEPEELRALVDSARAAWHALGGVEEEPTPSERKSSIFRRSLYVVADVAVGERFTERNVRSIRPGHGLPPKHLPDVLGKRASRAIARGTPLDWDLVAPPNTAPRG